MSNNSVEYLASFFFAVSILHTFSVSIFNKYAQRFPKGSWKEVLLHLLGEVEVVFGFWSVFFILGYAYMEGVANSFDYLKSRNYTEPLFVFVIMVVCSSKPVRDCVSGFISNIIRIPGVKPQVAFFFTLFGVVPLLGSFITEPAAMTIAATVALTVLFEKNKIPESLKYAMLGLLFVNISIGGTLTPYAAPPVLMVTEKWSWDMQFMLTQFGWKAALACFVSTLIYFIYFQETILSFRIEFASERRAPTWLQFVFIGIIIAIVYFHKTPIIFGGLFILFLAVVKATQGFQDKLKIKESMLVAFFLAGLVILGGLQSWWLEPIISSVGATVLFVSAIALTAVTDNAAITFLGTLVSSISDESKYALVAGAVIGGGLTVIANAPNPAGYGILKSGFGPQGINATCLFLGALIPTLVAALVFWFL